MDGTSYFIGRTQLDYIFEGASATGETGLRSLPLPASARAGGQHYGLAMVLPLNSPFRLDPTKTSKASRKIWISPLASFRRNRYDYLGKTSRLLLGPTLPRCR